MRESECEGTKVKENIESRSVSSYIVYIILRLQVYIYYIGILLVPVFEATPQRQVCPVLWGGRLGTAFSWVLKIPSMFLLVYQREGPQVSLITS